MQIAPMACPIFLKNYISTKVVWKFIEEIFWPLQIKTISHWPLKFQDNFTLALFLGKKISGSTLTTYVGLVEIQKHYESILFNNFLEIKNATQAIGLFKFQDNFTSVPLFLSKKIWINANNL